MRRFTADASHQMRTPLSVLKIQVALARRGDPAALPEIADGLKPVHRRVLYSMFDSGFRPERGYVQCSRVVGDVMGN